MSIVTKNPPMASPTLDWEPGQSILQRIAEGDEDAVEGCIAKYQKLIWSMALKMSPTPADAEDAMQEIFMEIWKAAGKFQPELASEYTFVAMIARRRLIDRMRSHERTPDSADLTTAEWNCSFAYEASADLEIADEADRAKRCLDKLDSGQRHALTLAIHSGLSHARISEITKSPLGTVKSLIRRGLLSVRQCMARSTNSVSHSGGQA